MSEPVSVELNCGMRAVQVIHTDLGGYFTFNLGSGAQSNIDFSASNESPQSFNPSASGLPNRYGNPLAGCELRLSMAGFRPANIPITHTSDMGRVDIGTLSLERIATAPGSAVSVSSLLVPKDASKEFEKALKELQKNRAASALPHLEKAVSIYDKYSAAWNQLGRVYLNLNEREKAEQSFERAVAADPEYIPPLIHLASLQIQNQKWEAGAETAGKALELDPDLGFASFLQAVGNFNLQHLDEAERSAQQAEKAPHEDNPQVHALLAQIYMQKQDYVQAAIHMRSYLKESPDGNYAQKIKKDLLEIEEWLGAERNHSTSTTAVPGS
ncbi:MAG: tetratricopeptide repeat protein [Acidobacteria bacterium]|nr:tetratricopeptide repeat protein [Acidobacteriota bacterium]